MPTALQASRDFAARAIARLRSGVEGVNRDVRRPGPDIHVDPFGPTNVSTPAALIKVATAIHAGQRARANYEQTRETADLAREKARAEIARIRAEEQYYLGQGRQTSQPRPEHGLPPAPVTLPTGIGNIPANTPVDPRAVGVEQGRLRAEAMARRAAERRSSAKNLAAAKAAQLGLDADRERQITAGEAMLRRQVNRLMLGAQGGGKEKDDAVAGLGFDPNDLSQVGSAAQHKQALDQLFAAFRARKYAEYERLPAVRRRRQELADTITREALNLNTPDDPAAPAAPAADTVIQYDEQGNPIPAGP